MKKRIPVLWRPGAAAVFLVVALAAGCGEDNVAGVERPDAAALNLGRGSEALTVMTHNIYVGADVDRIVEAGSLEEVPVLVAITFGELISTNFPERAAAIADEIARKRPHLIGLQEISLIRYQTPGDFLDNYSVDAEDELLNFLEIVMYELRIVRGLDYDVAGIVQNADVELPMYRDFIPPATLVYDDVRLTDFDVVLARGDVQISNVAEVNYESVYEPEGLPIQIPRGYVAVDATVKNKTYRFVNTHLEPGDLDVQLDQAEELIEELRGTSVPVIVVGDLNTPAPTGETYRLFEMNGYVDTWTRNLEKSEGEGFTNPHDSDLRNAESNLYQRVDLIFVRNEAGRSGKTVIGPVFATVWGDEQGDRTAVQDLWPSDHAAVIAELRVPALGMPAYK